MKSIKTQKSLPKKETAKQSSKPKGQKVFETLRDWLGLLTAGAGIFVALIYLTGRSFADGYFMAMNIPSYQISFSLWEYGNNAWIPLFLFPLLMAFLIGLLGAMFSTVSDWTDALRVRFLNWLKQKVKFGLKNNKLPKASQETKKWFTFVDYTYIILCLIATLILTLTVASAMGQRVGKFSVLETSAKIEMISSVPMALDEDGLLAIQSSGQDYYVYKGLHMLTFNNGKYYFFKEIDPISCKPAKVYVVNADQNVQVNLLPAESLWGHCQGK